jgi:hypothetical protein
MNVNLILRGNDMTKLTATLRRSVDLDGNIIYTTDTNLLEFLTKNKDKILELNDKMAESKNSVEF